MNKQASCFSSHACRHADTSIILIGSNRWSLIKRRLLLNAYQLPIFDYRLSFVTINYSLIIELKKGAEKNVLDVSGFQCYSNIIELLFECFTSFTQPVVQCSVI